MGSIRLDQNTKQSDGKVGFPYVNSFLKVCYGTFKLYNVMKPFISLPGILHVKHNFFKFKIVHLIFCQMSTMLKQKLTAEDIFSSIQRYFPYKFIFRKIVIQQ